MDRNADDFINLRRPRRREQLARAFDIHRADFVPTQRLEVIRAMDQRAHARERRRGNFAAELKFDSARAGFRAARQFQNFPAARGEIFFDATADVTVAAGNRADIFVVHKCHIAAVSQPMRCALAITEKVIVVAGILGNTLASTT